MQGIQNLRNHAVYGFAVLSYAAILQLDQSIYSTHSELMVHQLKIHADGNSLAQIDVKLFALAPRQALEKHVAQVHQPLWPAGMLRDNRMPIRVCFGIDLVRHATDAATAKLSPLVIAVGSGLQHVGLVVSLRLIDVKSLDGGIVVVGKHDVLRVHGSSSLRFGGEGSDAAHSAHTGEKILRGLPQTQHT